MWCTKNVEGQSQGRPSGYPETYFAVWYYLSNIFLAHYLNILASDLNLVLCPLTVAPSFKREDKIGEHTVWNKINNFLGLSTANGNTYLLLNLNVLLFNIYYLKFSSVIVNKLYVRWNKVKRTFKNKDVLWPVDGINKFK